VIVCGASFAGLATARELAECRTRDGRAARVLLIDRYEVGERQTSACATPTLWLEAMGVKGSMLQTFDKLVLHTPHTTVNYELPWTFSTFDYPALCSLLGEQNDAQFDTATVTGVENFGAPPEGGAITVATDRGAIRAQFVVDALGWRRVLGRDTFPPQQSPLSRGLEVHPAGSGDQLELWVDRSLVPAGYGWSFPADREVRVGVGSFDPSYHVREPTVRLAQDVGRAAERYQGNWIPHRLREATESGVFFVGDSAGHCLPLTAEGIRTAFYFGIAAGREIRRALEGRGTRATALRRYSEFSARHRWQFESMLKAQRVVPRIPPRMLSLAAAMMGSRAFARWSFDHYLRIAHPSYAYTLTRPASARRARSAEAEREPTLA
jgi:flavin-dependent dehydrogenase